MSSSPAACYYSRKARPAPLIFGCQPNDHHPNHDNDDNINSTNSRNSGRSNSCSSPSSGSHPPAPPPTPQVVINQRHPQKDNKEEEDEQLQWTQADAANLLLACRSGVEMAFPLTQSRPI